MYRGGVEGSSWKTVFGNFSYVRPLEDQPTKIWHCSCLLAQNQNKGVIVELSAARSLGTRTDPGVTVTTWYTALTMGR